MKQWNLINNGSDLTKRQEYDRINTVHVATIKIVDKLNYNRNQRKRKYTSLLLMKLERHTHIHTNFR